jgi:hypothetical protein
VKLEDGHSCSFWRDVWFADDALADVYPALFSPCTSQEATVNEVSAAWATIRPGNEAVDGSSKSTATGSGDNCRVYTI